MTSTLLTQETSIYEKARIKFRSEFQKGIKPVDGRQPIPDELATIIVQELIDSNVPKNALIGVIDAFLIFSTHLKEAGFTNLVLMENHHSNLSNSKEKYYNNVKDLCEKSSIKYYVPPMNNYNRCDMKFDVIIGNPPYQAPKDNNKRGKGGNNSLYIQFIQNGVKLLNDGGNLMLITPPAALIKSTVLHQPSQTLKMMIEEGSLTEIDLTVGKHFKVGSHICKWTWVKGKKQDKVKVITEDFVQEMNIEDLYYLPPQFTELELNLYRKIISNKNGDILTVVRDKPNQDCTMERFGYPKVQLGGSGVLGFDKKFYEFFTSKLGLWLLDYIRRHDQMIYHNLLTGLFIGDIELTDEEEKFINDGNWINFSRKEIHS